MGREDGMEKNYAEVQERIKCARNKMNKQQHLETDWKKAKLKVHLGRRKQDPDFCRSGKIRSLEKVLLIIIKKKDLVACDMYQEANKFGLASQPRNLYLYLSMLSEP